MRCSREPRDIAPASVGTRFGGVRGCWPPIRPRHAMRRWGRGHFVVLTGLAPRPLRRAARSQRGGVSTVLELWLWCRCRALRAHPIAELRRLRSAGRLSTALQLRPWRCAGGVAREAARELRRGATLHGSVVAARAGVGRCPRIRARAARQASAAPFAGASAPQERSREASFQ
jgi:hypothetical protein